MAWTQWQIEHKGKSILGWVDEKQLTFDVPFELDIKVGDTFKISYTPRTHNAEIIDVVDEFQLQPIFRNATWNDDCEISKHKTKGHNFIRYFDVMQDSMRTMLIIMMCFFVRCLLCLSVRFLLCPLKSNVFNNPMYKMNTCTY